MDYRISFLSPQGHARELADSFRRLLPSHTPVTDLSQQFCEEGRVHLIGFEYSGPDCEEIPVPVRQLLDRMQGKDLVVFATCPVCIDSRRWESLDRYIFSLVPADCRYHGLFLCQGEVYLNILEQTKLLSAQPGQENAKLLLRQYRKGIGHPNREDIRNGCRFISEALSLEFY